MMEKKLYIKNMVCDRCIKVIQMEVERLGIVLNHIELGAIYYHETSEQKHDQLKAALETNGFIVLLSQEERLVEQVKIELLKLVQELPLLLDETLSKYLERQLHIEYSKISKIFSATEGSTLEKYFIKLKLEKAKELIQLGELNFTEISQLLNYTNINHLSRQFKNKTGISLTAYKNEQGSFRNSLDEII